MKTLTVDKADYDDILYPAVALDPVKEPAALRVVLGVLDKLEAAGERQTKGALVCGNCGEVVKPAQGVALYKLADASAEFQFEDAEAEFVAERLKAGIQQLSASRARSILPMLEALEAAGS